MRFASLAALLVALGCSNKVDVLTSETGGAATFDNGTGGAGATGGSTGTDATGGKSPFKVPACPGIINNTIAADAGMDVNADAGAACTGIGYEPEPSFLDMFIMMDRSYSMTYPVQNTALKRWDVLQQGVQQFMNDPDVVKKNPRVGLGFFSKTGNPNSPGECDPNTYAVPQIEMEYISTGAAKILQAIADEAALLGGQTAWQPALQGALMHAQSWQQKDTLGRMTAVVLVTDGYPTECDQDVANISEMVGEYYTGIQGSYNTVGAPGIRTYVVGIAVDKYNLDVVAQAGGTGAATIIDSAGAVDQFVNTMVNITKADIECDYKIPAPNDPNLTVDTNKVQVFYQPFVGDHQEIPKASSQGCDSANGGWYFDNEANPTKVTLCPCSCANLGAGRIEFRFGCRPATRIN